MARSLGLLLLCGISHVLVLPIPVAAENESNLPFRGERATQSKADKPNIVLVLVDDQGHGDIGLDDESEFYTPTLKDICDEGVKLEQFYSGATCTPSRAMLMTGRYALRFGFQDSVVHSTEPRGVPLSEAFLPEKLKRVGYETVMIGKWYVFEITVSEKN